MKRCIKFIKKGLSYIKQFVCRLKNKGLRRHEQFIISLIFTYLLTIAFSIVVIFNYFQDRMVAVNFTQGLWEYIMTTKSGFAFGYCKELSATMYMAAKLFEALIPTTLTFCGLIFVTQNIKAKHNYLNAFLAIVLFGLVMIGMVFMEAKLETMLVGYMRTLIGLVVVAIMMSAKLFSLENKENSLHKNEPSDGKISG